jgi:hypothetical protein
MDVYQSGDGGEKVQRVGRCEGRDVMTEPEWARDPDVVIERNAKIEREVEHHAAGCAALLHGLIVLATIAGIIGGVLALLK